MSASYFEKIQLNKFFKVFIYSFAQYINIIKIKMQKKI